MDPVFDVLYSAFQATLGTGWFVLGLLAAIYLSPGRFHL